MACVGYDSPLEKLYRGMLHNIIHLKLHIYIQRVYITSDISLSNLFGYARKILQSYGGTVYGFGVVLRVTGKYNLSKIPNPYWSDGVYCMTSPSVIGHHRYLGST
jgi:hypothetical protein